MAAEKRRKRKVSCRGRLSHVDQGFALDSAWDLVLHEHPNRHG